MTRAIRYAFEEALASVWRGRHAGIVSTLTIAVALFVVGIFLMLIVNLERLGGEWSRAAEMSVYLDDGATPDERDAIERALTPSAGVAAHEFVSSEEALRRFKQTFTDLAASIDSTGDNPLPASFELRLSADSVSRDAIDQLAMRLRAMPGVADLRYDRQWIGRLQSAIGVIRGIGIGLGAILGLAAAMTVANVVRLALFARRDELDIMQLVGAPQLYVRGPFIAEGILQGGAGAVLAFVALVVAFLAVRGRYLMPLASSLGMPAIGFLPLGFSAALIVGGMLVGCVGGLIAAWQR